MAQPFSLARMSYASFRLPNGRPFQSKKRRRPPHRHPCSVHFDRLKKAALLKRAESVTWKRRLVTCSANEGSSDGAGPSTARETTLRPTVSVEEPQPIVVHAKVAQSSGAWFGSVILVLMVTVGTVSAAMAAFVMYLRPTLKIFEETCRAAEKASHQLESAAVGLEEAAIMFDETLPPALKSVEQASKEFEELGQNLNSFSGGLLSRRPARHRRREREAAKDEHKEENKMEAALIVGETAVQQNKSASPNITRQTMDGINRVASDITSFTRNFGPAMSMWRKRLTSIVSTVEAERGDQQQLIADVVSEAGEQGRTGINGSSTGDVVQGVSIDADSEKPPENDESYADLSDLSMEDIFKDKDSLIARFASESTGDAASEIMDALYKAEEAAGEAARASGDLQEAVERACNSGEFPNFIAWGNAEQSESSNEFFEPDYSGTIRYDAATADSSDEETH